MVKHDYVVFDIPFSYFSVSNVNYHQSLIGCSQAGLNLARMLGDKFLKQQDARFSAEPYISQVVYINQSNRSFALLARWSFVALLYILISADELAFSPCLNAEESRPWREREAAFLFFFLMTLKLVVCGFGCSDGFWDVINVKKAVQLVNQV